jgi:hypothetical protein
MGSFGWFGHVRLDSYERNLACRLGGPGIALQAALRLAKEGYQELVGMVGKGWQG